MRLKTSVVAFLVAAFASGVPAPLPAHAQGGVPLPVKGPGFVLVDGEHELVFVTGDFEGTTVAVVDFQGNVVTTLEDLPGPRGMAVVDDKLYVLTVGVGSIRIFDIPTFVESDPVYVGPVATSNNVTGGLVAAGGRLWFAGGVCDQFEAVIKSFDPATRRVRTELSRNISGTHMDCPDMRSPGLRSDLLVTYETGTTAAEITQWNVATSPPTPELIAEPEDATGVLGADFSSDGLELFVRNAAPYETRSFSILDMNQVWRYDATAAGTRGGPPRISPDGERMAVDFSDDRPQLKVFSVDNGIHRATLDFPADGRAIMDFDWSPDGRTLFATFGATGETAYLYVLSVEDAPAERAPTALSLSLSRSTRVYGGGPVRAEIELTSTEEVLGREVAVYVTTPDGVPRLLGRVPVDAQGDAEQSVELVHNSSIYAVFEGDQELEPTRSRLSLLGIFAKVGLDVRGSHGRDGRFLLFGPRREPILDGRVRPVHRREPLAFVGAAFKNGRWRVVDVAAYRLDSKGRASARWVTSRTDLDYRFRTVFLGNRRNLGAASPWRYVRYAKR